MIRGFLASLLTRCVCCSGCVILLFFVLTGCSTGEKKAGQTDPDSPYYGWKEYSCNKVRILYAPGHPHESRLEEYCRNYSMAVDLITKRLEMKPYTDTLLVVFYTGYGQGREITGEEYPFGMDTAIHFWLPSFPGPTLVQHFLPRWSPGEPRHQFIKHGLIALYDFSGQDYHRSTVNYQNEGQFISLRDLVQDTTINSNTERHQSAEAASFCAFVVGEWGVATLKELYESSLPFEQTVKKVLGLNSDSLETIWLEFAAATIRPDTTGDTLGL